MNRFFGITMIVLAMLMTEECDDFMGDLLTGGAMSADLAKSQKEEERAAASVAQAVENDRQSTLDAIEATSAANLGRGENISFGKIDNAIELSPNYWSLYFTKAAMQIAAGKDPRETEGQALSALRRGSVFSTEPEDVRYKRSYTAALSDVAQKMPAGPNRDRILTKVCPELKAIWVTGDKSWRETPCP